MLEEELILSADFLSFMAQCLPVVEKDNTLIGATGWNVNGQYLNFDMTFPYLILLM